LYYKYNSLSLFIVCIFLHNVSLRYAARLCEPDHSQRPCMVTRLYLRSSRTHTQRYAQSTVVTAAVFNEQNETVAHLCSTVRGLETRVPRCEDRTVSL
jgi:hypothetical protein